MPATPIRVLAIASGGGHWVQLLRMRPAWEGCAVSYATVHADSAVDVPGAKFFTFPNVSRKDWWALPGVALAILGLIRKARPDVIVTTGAAPPLLALAIGRLFGARTLWIDSIANGEELSTSGRLAQRVAHQVATQWPELAAPAGPVYWGSVL